MNNVQLIVAVVAFVGLLFTILAGAWLNQRGLGRQMDSFRNEIKAQLNEFKSEFNAQISEFKSEANARFDVVDAQLGAIQNQVSRIDRQVEAIFKPVLPKS
jgi:peptidoglycan hydrolase CwlO-like protein